MEKKKLVLDVGCGTGILSFMYTKKIGNEVVNAIDSNLKAVESTRLNTHVLDLGGRVEAMPMDLIKAVESKQVNAILDEMK